MSLVIGGFPAELLAARVGETPFFAYDRVQVAERVAAVRAALPGAVSLHYAVKANPMPALLHHLSGLVDGFDVASAGELRRALDTSVPAEHIAFAGPGKRTADLRQAVAAGVLVEVESALEVTRLRAEARDLGLRARIAVRVNPDFMLRGAGMRMGGGPQQFGVDAEAVPALLRSLDCDELEFLGFHVFAGSQNLHAASISETQEQTVALVSRLAAGAPGPVRYLSLGGGFGIPYAARDKPLDLCAVGTRLAALMGGPVAEALPDARIVIELGRYLVGEAGVYLTRVVDRKVSRGKTYLVVDGGMHHQLAAAGHLGQAIRRNYPIGVAHGTAGQPAETVNIVGSLCTPLDTLGIDVELPRTEVGDLIAVFQAGAYGLTASPTAFLGHDLPPEILV